MGDGWAECSAARRTKVSLMSLRDGDAVSDRCRSSFTTGGIGRSAGHGTSSSPFSLCHEGKKSEFSGLIPMSEMLIGTETTGVRWNDHGQGLSHHWLHLRCVLCGPCAHGWSCPFLIPRTEQVSDKHRLYHHYSSLRPRLIKATRLHHKKETPTAIGFHSSLPLVSANYPPVL